jgi:hypothetical protein
MSGLAWGIVVIWGGSTIFLLFLLMGEKRATRSAPPHSIDIPVRSPGDTESGERTHRLDLPPNHVASPAHDAAVDA